MPYSFCLVFCITGWYLFHINSEKQEAIPRSVPWKRCSSNFTTFTGVSGIPADVP